MAGSYTGDKESKLVKTQRGEMSRTDLVADALTIIRNASRSNKEDVIVPYSNVLNDVMRILKEEGYIDNFKVLDAGSVKNIKVYLRYKKGKSAITQLKRVSRSGRRVYVDKKSIPNVLSGYGRAIISTSKGVVSNVKAKEMGIGGEVICYVW